MGYLKIPNLYKDASILAMKECYALEKIHGTSAHISFLTGEPGFFSGGEKYDNFVRLFDAKSLQASRIEAGYPEDLIIYGEAYGGKQQGMSLTYGPKLRFTAFDVKMENKWLDVPAAERVVRSLGLDFVHYARIETTREAVDAERDKPSTAAAQAGIIGKTGEGVVLRPIFELMRPDGSRLIAKHKRHDYAERTSKADTQWPSEKQEEALRGAAVAEEWVTPHRLDHVLQKVLVGGDELGFRHLSSVADAMCEDVKAEAGDRVVWSKLVHKLVAGRAVMLAKQRIMKVGV